MVYYELYGLPGAGKTTITSSLVDKLKAEGYKVAERKDVYIRRGSKINSKSVYWEMLFQPSEYKLIWYYLMLYLKCKQKNRYHLKNLLFYSHQILMTIKEGKYDMMFLDAGIIEYIASLFYMDCPLITTLIKSRDIFQDEISPLFFVQLISVKV